MTAELGKRQPEVKHKNAGLPSVFIHPSSFGGNCRTTPVSSHRKRRCYSFIFLFGNSVLSTFRVIYFKNTFFIRAQFISWLPFVRKNPNRMWIQQTDLVTAVCVWWWCSRQRRPQLCARVRNDRNWREKRSTRSSLPAAMSTVVEQALVLS